MTVDLPALSGLNPLGVLAALGVLGAVGRQTPELDPRLSWTDTIVPRAVLHGPPDLATVIRLADDDRRQWLRSPVLTWGPGDGPLDDLKPSLDDLRSWAGAILDATNPRERATSDLFCALVAEGAAASGKGDAKPTHLHFTAGQQRFLSMVRELCESVDADRLTEALAGPWRYDSPLPMLRWDARGERIYALRGFKPSGDKPLGVPGADWLAFLGLAFLPVFKQATKGTDQLATTGCVGRWKDGSLRWPLWSVALPESVIRSLLATDLSSEPVESRRRRGVSRVLEAPIRRAERGSRGNVGPASDIGPQSRAGSARGAS